MPKPIRIGLMLIAPILALASAQTVSANHVDCFGRNVPHANIGGPGNDHFTGTDQADVFYGGDGRDTIQGFRGGDSLCGGADKDLIFGGRGPDLINGQRGSDGANTPRAELRGGDGRDEVLGRSGNDFIKLGPGRDFGHGNSGDDRVNGIDDVGHDVVDGGDGNGDVCFGDLGDKFFGCESS
jgi:Ca2+-binding RTX toxin-like protein